MMTMTLDVTKMLDKAASISDHLDAITALDRDRKKLIESLQQECSDLNQMAKIMGVVLTENNVVPFAKLILTVGSNNTRNGNSVVPVPVVTPEAVLDNVDFLQEVAQTTEE